MIQYRFLLIKIYTSNNYGQTLTRIWTSDIPLNDSIILHPLVFANTGHIAFIYQMMNDSICCQYFAVFSRTGLISFPIFKSSQFCLIEVFITHGVLDYFDRRFQWMNHFSSIQPVVYFSIQQHQC